MFKIKSAIIAVSILVFTGFSLASEIPAGRVIVTSTLTEKDIKNAPGSIEVITFDEILEKGADSIAEALEDSLGMLIITQPGRVQTPNLRGSGTKHTLVLIDGKRVADGFKDLSDLNRIPVEMVDRIEVLRGPSSALYGSDALGGIVNIITKNPEKDFHGGINFKYSQDKKVDAHGTRYGGYLTDTIGKFGYFVSASNKRKNHFEYNGSGPDDGDHKSSSYLHGKMNYDLNEKNKITAGYDFSIYERDGMRDFQGKDRLRQTDDKKSNYNLSYDYSNNKNLNAGFMVNHSIFESNVKMSPEPDSDFNTIKNQVDETGFRVSSSYFANQILTFGSDFRKYTRTEETLREDDSENFGVFFQDEISLGSKFYLVGGIRYDDHSEAGDFYAPKASFIYKPLESLRLKASWGRGFRAPSLSELFTTGYRKRGKEVYLPNDDLSPEESSSYEFGVEGEKGRFKAGLVYFRTFIDELIYPEYLKTTGSGKKKVVYYQYQNLKNAGIYGYEADFSVKLVKGLSLSCRLSFADNEDQDYSDYKKAQVKISQKLEKMKLSWNIRGNFVGDLNNGGGYEYEDYTTWHFYLNKDLGKYLKLYMGGDNIFDKENEDLLLNPAAYYCGFSLDY